ncbi:hypothetical protein Zmor_004333 [Zophobas morio]|uniref:Uncharacterized protein n=1 Tax=Zophobas morio TaxID=2755281 RepID=A0AA38M114_9CUCU|nr:hypothetical protein Zmor_004333 [Zophobas morio]
MPLNKDLGIDVTKMNETKYKANSSSTNQSQKVLLAGNLYNLTKVNNNPLLLQSDNFITDIKKLRKKVISLNNSSFEDLKSSQHKENITNLTSTSSVKLTNVTDKKLFREPSTINLEPTATFYTKSNTTGNVELKAMETTKVSTERKETLITTASVAGFLTLSAVVLTGAFYYKKRKDRMDLIKSYDSLFDDNDKGDLFIEED